MYKYQTEPLSRQGKIEAHAPEFVFCNHCNRFLGVLCISIAESFGEEVMDHMKTHNITQMSGVYPFHTHRVEIKYLKYYKDERFNGENPNASSNRSM